MFFVEVVVSMPRAMMISTVGPTARKAFFMCLFMDIVGGLVRGTVLAVISSVLVWIIVAGERGQRQRCREHQSGCNCESFHFSNS